MDITEELLKNSIVSGIELHAVCLVLVIFLYVNMRRSFARNNRKKEIPLIFVYGGIALMLVSDCTWSSMSQASLSDNIFSYIVNLLYFFGSSTAAACWLLFCASHLDTKFSVNRKLRIAAMIPFIIVILLYVLSCRFRFIFYIQDGQYVRGSLFYLDPVIKLGYVGWASFLAIRSGRKKEMGYLRKKDYNYVLFGVPVLISGLLQTLTGVDFNCIGVTFGLVLIYVTGITNPDNENTDALYSLANSFEASYIVNMDTGLIRPLKKDTMHDYNSPGMKYSDFSSHFNVVLSNILLPEDRKNTLDIFKIENVAERFKIDSSFSIRYRVKDESGHTILHSASFIKAEGEEGKQEFLLGINTLSSDSLLYERNEILSQENKRLEQINTSIIDSVAKIVEARDMGSGEHIIRVKKLTEIIAREIMTECPEFKLDEEMVKLISSASVLHDVGKIAIPDAVLLKPGRLTDEEFEIMKTHSVKGCEFLNMFPLGLDDAFLECALSICRWHHEKYDGRGYPDGLIGDEIPIAAQIVSVADCFDALVSDRPYKKAFTPEKAFEMIVNGECGAFSPKIIEAMTKQKSRLKELAILYK